ncbi:hypothetical protein, partial [Plasmodium yoelii yoelii]
MSILYILIQILAIYEVLLWNIIIPYYISLNNIDKTYLYHIYFDSNRIFITD